MKPLFLRLYNFMCYDFTELDLSGFSSALIIGKANDNELYSNGVGKSTLFKAIEFCLFNECAKGLKLEKLVRDEADKCRIVLDFELNGVVYRVSRSRTRKGISDLSLYEKYNHTDADINPHTLAIEDDEITFKKYWKDISGRRASDTEEALSKIHKMNYDAFCSGYYFAQDDRASGLATATKSDRKKILKNSLQLSVYTALNKLATNESSLLSKQISEKNAAINALGRPAEEIAILEVKAQATVRGLEIKSQELAIQNQKITNKTNEVNQLKLEASTISAQVDSVLKRQQESKSKISKLENQVNDYSNKRKSLIADAKSLSAAVEEIKKNKSVIVDPSLETINQIKITLEKGKVLVSEKSTLLSLAKAELTELQIPLPNEAFCKHCRQPLTDAHRLECEKNNNEKIKQIQENIQLLIQDGKRQTAANTASFASIQELEKAKNLFSTLSSQLITKEKEYQDKKALYAEYEGIYKKYNEELESAKLESLEIVKEVEASSSKELEKLNQVMQSENLILDQLVRDLDILNKDSNKLSNDKAVISFSLQEKKNNIAKIVELSKEVQKIEEDFAVLSDVLESFGPTGIPNLIIHNILDDLQAESNTILEQIRPGLQLSFAIEKTKGDGQLGDDLDIDYFLNGKPRDYAQLSGAQKLCIMFSLKLGVAFLLQKTIGITFNLLLLDEIDQALDKASIDAFADIIRVFQKDFTILVITHNDRLQEKFKNIILVEQDQDMVSKARLMTA